MNPLQMDDDYPVGTYTYTGALIGQSLASVSYTFVMRVARAWLPAGEEDRTSRAANGRRTVLLAAVV